ncbi:hypothetical protein K458DRAFT_422024, partial [Lentithecium fluviatile CBS 122367]
MARLSIENLSNSAPNTPQQPSKSSRFKDLFKGSNSRSSLSPGSNTADLAETSPQGTAENAKSGFRKVGLLPSERTEKLKKQKKGKKRESSRESLERQAKELKDIAVPHGLDTELEASGVRLGGTAGTESNIQEHAVREIRESSEQDLIKNLQEDQGLKAASSQEPASDT